MKSGTRRSVTWCVATAVVALMVASGHGEADDLVSATSKKLPIKLIRQAKDTRLLLPELPSSQETGPHAWNKPHTWSDPAEKEGCAICKANCGPASIAMVAAYYGGRVSQDRLRYELYSSRSEGPLNDFGWIAEEGRFEGLDSKEMRKLLQSVVNTGVTRFTVTQATTSENLFAFGKAFIDAKAPVIVFRPGHVMVISGYVDEPGHRAFYVLDPSAVNTEIPPTPSPGAGNREGIYELLGLDPPGKPKPVSDDKSITQNPDGDAVMSFDESKRFLTDPARPDSDEDGVKDGFEIRYWTFGGGPGSGTGYSGTFDKSFRDRDSDGLPNELDPHSDSAEDLGCMDGLEDANANGRYEPGELDPLDPPDDACLSGTDTFSYYADWGFGQTWDVRLVLSLSFRAKEGSSQAEGRGSLRAIMAHEDGGCYSCSNTVDQIVDGWKYEGTYDDKRFSFSQIDPPYSISMWTCWGGGAGDLYPYCNPYLVTGRTKYKGEFKDGVYTAQQSRKRDAEMLFCVGSFCIDNARAYCDWEDVLELVYAKE